jgi:hypothetical protein
MSDRLINFASFPPTTEAEIEAPVLLDDLKAAWPYCRNAAQQKHTGTHVGDYATLPVAVRCGLLEELLGGAEPTEEQFAAIAQTPLDGSVSREEILKRLGVKS